MRSIAQELIDEWDSKSKESSHVIDDAKLLGKRPRDEDFDAAAVQGFIFVLVFVMFMSILTTFSLNRHLLFHSEPSKKKKSKAVTFNLDANTTRLFSQFAPIPDLSSPPSPMAVSSSTRTISASAKHKPVIKIPQMSAPQGEWRAPFGFIVCFGLNLFSNSY